jgi:multicomponent Na+:H+ antiporter subunit C
VIDLFLARYVYFLVVVLLAIGLYCMLAHRNLVKKIIAMLIFQTAIFVFFIEGAVKEGAEAPVLRPGQPVDAADYVNPLPHLLILTAIVVGVGIVGVAFALLLRLHRTYGTLDEEAILGIIGAAEAPLTDGSDVGDPESEMATGIGPAPDQPGTPSAPEDEA